MKLISQEMLLSIQDLQLTVSDLQKSFVLNAVGENFVYKIFRVSLGSSKNLTF